MRAHGKLTQVAVKRLKPNATSVDQQNFLKEAWTIGQFNHANVVKLEGVVTKSKSWKNTVANM